MDYNDSVYDYDEYEGEFLDEPGIKSAFQLFCLVCYILILCISVPGNILLLWVLWRERAWKTTHDILLLQLIMSDYFLTLALISQAVFALNHSMYGLKGVVFFWGLNSYVLILSAIVMNHYVSVVHASHLPAQSRKILCMVSFVLWLVSAVPVIKVLVSAAIDDRFGMSGWAVIFFNASHLFTDFDVYMQLVVFFLIPLMIITFCCVHMCITNKNCCINRHHQDSIPDTRHQDSRPIVGMIAVFFLSLVPYNIFLFIKTVPLGIQFEWTQAVQCTELIADTLLYFPCCLNPLLYLFGVERFRRHLPIPCKTSSQRRDGIHNIELAAVPTHDPDGGDQHPFITVSGPKIII